MQDFLSPEQKRFIEIMATGTAIDRVVFEQVVQSDAWRAFRMEFRQEKGLEAMCLQIKEFVSKYPNSWDMSRVVEQIVDVINEHSVVPQKTPRMEFLRVLCKEMSDLGF